MARRRGRRKSAKGQLSPAGKILTEPSTPRSTNVNIPTSDPMDLDALDARHAELHSDVPLYRDAASRGLGATRSDMHIQPAAGASSGGFTLLPRQLRTPRLSRSFSTNDNTPPIVAPRVLSQTPETSGDGDEQDSSFSQHAEEYLSPASAKSETLFDRHVQIIKAAEDLIHEMKHELSLMSTETPDMTREQRQLLFVRARRQREWIFSHELYLALVKVTIDMTKTVYGVEGDDPQQVLEQPRRRIVRGWLTESIRRLPIPPELKDPIVIDPEVENMFQQISHFFLVSVIETNLDTVFKGRSLPRDTEITKMFLRNNPEKAEDWSDDIGPSLRKKIDLEDATSYSVEDVLNRLQARTGPIIPALEQSVNTNADPIVSDGERPSSPFAYGQSVEQDYTSSSHKWSIQSPSQRVYDPSFLVSEEPSLPGCGYNERQRFDMERGHGVEGLDMGTMDSTFMDNHSLQYPDHQRRTELAQQDHAGFEEVTEHFDLMDDDDDTVLQGTPHPEASMDEHGVENAEQYQQPISQPNFSSLTGQETDDVIESREPVCEDSQMDCSACHSHEPDSQMLVEPAVQALPRPDQLSAQKRLAKQRVAAMSAEDWEELRNRRLPSSDQLSDSRFLSMSPSPGIAADSHLPLASEDSQALSLERDALADDQPPTFEAHVATEDQRSAYAPQTAAYDQRPVFDNNVHSVDIAMEDVSDVPENQPAVPTSSQATVRARSRKSEPIVLISSQRSSIFPSAIMQDADFITDDEDDEMYTSIHPMLAVACQGSAAQTLSSSTLASSASASRTPKLKLPPHLAPSRRAAHRKSLDPSSAIPTAEERLEHSQEEYPLIDIVDEKVIGGVLKYRIKWKPINGRAFEDTWEPAENANEEAVRDWELIKERLKEAKAKRTKRKRSSVVAADPDLEMVTEPVSQPDVNMSAERFVEPDVETTTEPVAESPEMTISRIINEKHIDGNLQYRIRWKPIGDTTFPDSWTPVETTNGAAVADWIRRRDRYDSKISARAVPTPQPVPQLLRGPRIEVAPGPSKVNKPDATSLQRENADAKAHNQRSIEGQERAVKERIAARAEKRRAEATQSTEAEPRTRVHDLQMEEHLPEEPRPEDDPTELSQRRANPPRQRSAAQQKMFERLSKEEETKKAEEERKQNEPPGQYASRETPAGFFEATFIPADNRPVSARHAKLMAQNDVALQVWKANGSKGTRPKGPEDLRDHARRLKEEDRRERAAAKAEGERLNPPKRKGKKWKADRKKSMETQTIREAEKEKEKQARKKEREAVKVMQQAKAAAARAAESQPGPSRA
ncbi:hypothetical protein D6D01_04966 [Aureobasidium pullulans]|uniref:Chromo domain-containing protein n=1 Tax=Aureobasidium pullulans TaxID=5580 RepID=A0A4S9LAL5_AURPU|nr:hypothetical protein D6D01_04966 [Aureobasidium pullulans]